MTQKTGFYGKLNTVFLKHNTYNTLFLGSSRAEMHYDVPCIDSLTNWKGYNAGLAGASPMIAFAVLKIYLNKSNCPERVFYEVDLHRLKESSTEIFEFNNYFPLLSDPLIRKEFSKIDARMPHFYLNPFYSLPYTGLKNISTGLHAWLGLPTQSDALYHNGFMKDTINTFFNYIPLKAEAVFLSDHNKNYLDSMVQLCKKSGIQLFLLSSPYFAGGQLSLLNKKQMVKDMAQYAHSRGLPYWDLSSLSFCNRRELFRDEIHLNAKGAELFSRYFVDYLNTKVRGIALN
jgi:hypothetical protein